MSNYSPGPWQMGPYDYRFIFDSLGRNVAMLDFIEDGNETVANARLISAAPRMYEALENLENDDGAIPEHAWQLVKAALDAAGAHQ